jgi:hypothetical protein
MRTALAWSILTLLAGACGETRLNKGIVIPTMEHIANQCPAQKDIPNYTITDMTGAPGIHVKTNDTGLNDIEVDGLQKTRTFDQGKTYYIYRAGCKDGGYTVNYQLSNRNGSIVVAKTKAGYTSTQQFADEKQVIKQVTK